MENGTKQCGIDLCTYFVRCFQSSHMTVIESQAAIQIAFGPMESRADAFGFWLKYTCSACSFVLQAFSRSLSPAFETDRLQGVTGFVCHSTRNCNIKRDHSPGSSHRKNLLYINVIFSARWIDGRNSRHIRHSYARWWSSEGFAEIVGIKRLSSAFGQLSFVEW